MSFKFTIKIGPEDEGRGLVAIKSRVREADNWVDVPLAAIPVIQEGWPEMPEYMNGRQYFLWWKNGFKTNQDKAKGEIGMPIIVSPYKEYKDVKYVMGGQQSRQWGA